MRDYALQGLVTYFQAHWQTTVKPGPGQPPVLRDFPNTQRSPIPKLTPPPIFLIRYGTIVNKPLVNDYLCLKTVEVGSKSGQIERLLLYTHSFSTYNTVKVR